MVIVFQGVGVPTGSKKLDCLMGVLGALGASAIFTSTIPSSASASDVVGLITAANKLGGGVGEGTSLGGEGDGSELGSWGGT